MGSEMCIRDSDSVLENLDETQKEAFRQLWDRLPSHMRKIQFGLESKYWTVKDINELADVLCKYSHRFSKDNIELGYCTVDPFKIELKPGTRPVKQRPYRHNPAVQKKVQIEIDRMFAAGLLRRSYSNWSRPLVVVNKADGSIRITCNYKKLNDSTIIPVLPLPTIE